MDHQAFAQLLGNYGEFVGAIAVVITLVYLAFQIRQNTNSLNAGSIYKSAELSSNSEVALTGYNSHMAWAKALDEPNTVSRGELMQAWAILALAYHSANQTYADYRDGLANEERWLDARALFIQHIDHPIGLIWWDEVKRSSGFSPSLKGFADSVDEGVKASPLYLMRAQFLRVMEKVQALPDDLSQNPESRFDWAIERDDV